MTNGRFTLRRPTRLGATAVLLNLSGLGLGYHYLRRFRIGFAHLAGTAALLVACVAGAVARAPQLWAAVAVLWLCWTAVHTWILASRSPSDSRRPRWPVIAAAAMVPVVLAAGVASLRWAAAAELDEGLAAHEAGDCETARSHYGRLVTLYGLAFSEASATALEQQRQCELLAEARGVAAEGDFEASFAAYEEYLAEEDAVAVGTVREELARAHLDYAEALWSEHPPTAPFRAYTDAFGQYGIVLADFPDSEAAGLVEESALAGYRAYREAIPEGEECDSRGPVRYFIDAPTLPSVEDSAALETAEAVAAEAAAELPGLLFTCGVDAYDSDNLSTAESLLRELVDDYPDDPNAAAAQDLLDQIAAEEAAEEAAEAEAAEEAAEAAEEAAEAEAEAAAEQAILDAIADARSSGGELSDPSPSGSTGDGSVTLEIGNASNLQLEVLYTGPETGSITIGACGDCAAQCGDWVAVWETLTLPAGEYEMVVRTTSGNVIPYYGVWGLDSGTAYQDCYYIE